MAVPMTGLQIKATTLVWALASIFKFGKTNGKQKPWRGV